MNAINGQDIKPLVIIGAGGLGREVAWLVEDINEKMPSWNLQGFIDDNLQGKTLEGYPILGNSEDLLALKHKPWVVVAIADTAIRRNIIKKLIDREFNLATLIHPTVSHSKYNKIGQGSIICSGSIITTNVTIGKACIINPGCFIGHDTILEDYISLMPATNIAGETYIATGCYFGMNSAVINCKVIGRDTVIGAGAVVVNDLPANVTAVGVPAKVIKKH